MALNRLSKNAQILFTSKQHHFIENGKLGKNWRNFRQGKSERPPQNFAETPFDAASVLNPSRLRFGALMKPLGFTIGFSTATFGGVAIWEYESMRAHAERMLRKPVKLFKRQTQEETLKNDRLKTLKYYWNKLSRGEKVFVPICALNILVFGAWRIPRLQPLMMKYFCSNPGSRNVCWPMLLSTFSHYSTFHIFANMFVLHSFCTGAVHSLGAEQFLGLYLSAGVISSFTSYLLKTVTKKPGLSLGASGAIMGVLGYICTEYPDTRLGIILIPFFTFSAGIAIKAIVGLDALGVVMGWKFFDHAAHLGGAFTGIFWALWGRDHVWANREGFLRYWHDVRGSIK